MSTEAASRADFSIIRYAQLWEDADILLEALDIQPDDVVLSIASAGDNALALIRRSQARVIAVDLNPAQIACLELRVAAFRKLSHSELLELLGIRGSIRDLAAGERRIKLYSRIRGELSPGTLSFWDAHPDFIREGAARVGKFERYFEMFRRRVMPLIHSRRTVEHLLEPGKTVEERRAFYESHWNTWRWRLLFHLFFSRWSMGRLGRDPAFFKYVEGSVASQILKRVRHALTELDPADNSYLHWILRGECRTALPFAYRAENFESIRANLSRLEWRLAAIEDCLDEPGMPVVTKFNLSDIFEYMSETASQQLLRRLHAASRPGGRLAYWNMLAPRHRPESMSGELRPLDELSRRLHAHDKAFFYSAFVVEEVIR